MILVKYRNLIYSLKTVPDVFSSRAIAPGVKILADRWHNRIALIVIGNHSHRLPAPAKEARESIAHRPL